MTLQGAVAVGTLAAMDPGRGAITIGLTGAALEMVFLVLAWKLFVQCGEVCRLMSSIEVDHVKVPPNLALKTVLISKPLFTSKVMKGVVLIAGGLFAVALGVAGLARGAS